MLARGVTPILNVSNLQATFEWFEKLGWQKHWQWGGPAGFGAVRSGTSEIFLCEGGQGGRGKSPVLQTFGVENGQTGDKGIWMTIWVDDVDAVHRECREKGIEIAFPPTDMEWNVREMHIRHPDGHVFRVSTGIAEE